MKDAAPRLKAKSKRKNSRRNQSPCEVGASDTGFKMLEEVEDAGLKNDASASSGEKIQKMTSLEKEGEDSEDDRVQSQPSKEMGRKIDIATIGLTKLRAKQKIEEKRGKSIDQLLESYHERGFIDILRRHSENRVHIQALEYTVAVLTDHCAQMRTEKLKLPILYRFFNVSRELMHIKGLPFNVLWLLECEVNKIESLRPLPSASEVDEFTQELEGIESQKVTGFDDKTVFDAAYRCVGADSKDAIAEDVLCQAALKDVNVAVRSLSAKFGKFQMLAYFLRAVSTAVKQSDLSLFTWLWCVSDIFQDMVVMRWTLIWYMADTFLSHHAVKHASDHFQVASFPSFQLLKECLLTYTWNLNQLKSIMYAQNEDASLFKNKAIAFSVTLGVTLGQFLSAAVYGQITEE